MGNDELIINLFRISRPEHKLKNQDVTQDNNANKVYYEVESRIRKIIQGLDEIMPKNSKYLVKT